MSFRVDLLLISVAIAPQEWPKRPTPAEGSAALKSYKHKPSVSHGGAVEAIDLLSGHALSHWVLFCFYDVNRVHLVHSEDL